MILRVTFCLCMVGSVYAQTPTDSLVHYELGDIVVTPSGASTDVSSISTTQRINLAAIAQADAPSIDNVLRRIPSAHLQTNSRGESLIYLRGAGERQVSLFFDGALLNIPWDNRVDLSLIPSEVVGEISISKGVPSVLYGANVLGGAINMISRQLRHSGNYVQLSGILGTHRSRQARFTWLQRRSRFQSTLFVGISDQEGFSLSRDADLPYSQSSETIRTNTDRQIQSLFGQIAFNIVKNGKIGVSLLRFDAQKGIAPEGHLNPADANVRFWRYPNWETNMAIVSGEFPFNFGTLKTAVWGSRFGQTITQYADDSYSQQIQTQIDQDDTYGVRLTYLRDFQHSGSLRAATTLIGSRHDQEDLEGQSASVNRVFSQRIISNGIEYAKTGQFNLMIGASLDVLVTPQTGDKPSRGSQTGFGATIGISRYLSEGINLRGIIGRKTRFPTMRELFGESLGRFLLNPNLKPESSFLSELSLSIERGQTEVELIGFLNRTFNTIGQEMIRLQGETKSRRQRVNLDGSRVFGVETILNTSINSRLRVSCNLTVMHPRELTPGGSKSLVETPSWIGGCNSNYQIGSGFSIITENYYSGRAYGLGDDNQLINLPSSLVANVRLSWLKVVRNYSAEIFGRINNITDEIVLPQLGLPAPGREFHIGIQLTLQ